MKKNKDKPVFPDNQSIQEGSVDVLTILFLVLCLGLLLSVALKALFAVLVLALIFRVLC